MGDVLRLQGQQRLARPAGQRTERVIDPNECAPEVRLEDPDRRAIVHDAQALGADPQ